MSRLQLPIPRPPGLARQEETGGGHPKPVRLSAQSPGFLEHLRPSAPMVHHFLVVLVLCSSPPWKLWPNTAASVYIGVPKCPKHQTKSGTSCWPYPYFWPPAIHSHLSHSASSSQGPKGISSWNETPEWKRWLWGKPFVWHCCIPIATFNNKSKVLRRLRSCFATAMGNDNLFLAPFCLDTMIYDAPLHILSLSVKN